MNTRIGDVRIRLSVCALLACGVAARLSARTLEVGYNVQYADIQSAVEAAEEGDIVLVQDGVYEIEAQIEIQKGIVVRSMNGQALTEIRRVNVGTERADAVERCVCLNHPAAVLDGFTISGGRIYSYSNVNVGDPSASGAGVLIGTAGGTLRNATVTKCLAGRSGVCGAGLAMLGSAGVVSNCVIRANVMGARNATTADGWTTYGGGVYMEGGLIVDSTIAENQVLSDFLHDGGGLYTKGGDVRRTRITDNVIHRAIFTTWSSYGAGVCVAGKGVALEDCLVARNRTNKSTGGALYASDFVTVRRCTFADNEAYVCAGTYFRAGALVEGCVYSGNRAYSDASAGAPDWLGRATCSNCLMSVAAPESSLDCQTAPAHFMDADYTLSPVTAKPDIGWKLPPRGTADFVRTGGSCLVGEDVVFTYGVCGEASALATFTRTFSLPGEQEVTHGGVTKRVRVSARDIHVQPGEDIQAAIDSAADGATVHVAAGLYELPQALVVTQAISLVGAGAAETTLRRSVSPVTGILEIGPYNTGASAERCLLVDHPGARANGFTLTGGWCYSGSCVNLAWAGSGARVGPLGGRLSDCVITGCGQARYSKGGALAVIGKGSVASNCTVTANVSRGWQVWGAGAWISGGGTITHSTIENNDITTGNQNHGAGVYAEDGRLSHSRVTGNTIGSNHEKGGAGVYAAAAGFVCDNCLIAANDAGPRLGGGVYGEAGTFVNCTIVGNAAGQGGGVYGTSQKLSFHNCLIQGNRVTADETAGAPEWNGAKALYSFCAGPKAFPNGEGHRTGTAVFERGSTYQIVAGSLAFDAGSSDSHADAIGATDLDGNPRVWGESVDIGCHEFFAATPFAAAIRSPARIYAGEAASFSALLVNLQGLPLVCTWSVPGMDLPPKVGAAFDVTFPKPGSMTVKLRVSSGEEFMDCEQPVYVMSRDLYVVPPGTPGHVAAFPYATQATAATNVLDAAGAADDGCRIHLSAGVHPVTNEIALLRGVTLDGTAGAEQTVVRRAEKGNGSGCRQYRVLRINHPQAVVRGLSVENGYLNDQQVRGAGVYIGGLGGCLADSIVSNNVLWANMYTYGAGVYMENGVVTNCLVTCNTNMTQHVGNGAYGGGLCLKAGAVLESRLERNVLFHNGAEKPTASLSSGGGAAVEGAGFFRNCLFVFNRSEGSTGGLSAVGGQANVAVSNCTFYGNVAVTATRAAGVEGFDAAGATVVNTAFAANVAGEAVSSVGASDRIVRVAVAEVDGAAFRSVARRDWRPRAHSSLVNAGVYADWMSGASDLNGRPRATGGRRVDIGACQANHAGLAVIVR